MMLSYKYIQIFSPIILLLQLADKSMVWINSLLVFSRILSKILNKDQDNHTNLQIGTSLSSLFWNSDHLSIKSSGSESQNFAILEKNLLVLQAIKCKIEKKKALRKILQ